MHAIQSPFTGLIVGGLSVLFISLIAHHAANPAKEIIKALGFVLVMKFSISPHAPIGAFFAVGLQAIIGAAFFRLIPSFSPAAIFSAALSLTLSAVQKVVILTLLFGTNLWSAIDQFSSSVMRKFGLTDTDLSIATMLVSGYILLYFVGGIVVGFTASRLPRIIEKRWTRLDSESAHFENEVMDSDRNKKNSLPTILLLILSILLLHYFFIGYEAAISQLIRLTAIIIGWILLVRPLVLWVVKNWVRKEQVALTKELNLVQSKIPELINFGKYAWKNRKFQAGFPITNFFILFLFYAIYRL